MSRETEQTFENSFSETQQSSGSDSTNAKLISAVFEDQKYSSQISRVESANQKSAFLSTLPELNIFDKNTADKTPMLGESGLASRLQEYSKSNASFVTETISIFQKENDSIARTTRDLPTLDLNDFSASGKQLELAKQFDGSLLHTDSVPGGVSGESSRFWTKIPRLGEVRFPPGLQPGQQVEFWQAKESNGSGRYCLMATSGNNTWLHKPGFFYSSWEKK